MQLFKRLLLSLFPSDSMTGNMNPASIFISFISSKEFFSIIHRKLVENYKLNQFDIALDPFEFKIGFGNNPTVRVEEIDLYYGYGGSANMNGYRVYNPSSIGYSTTLISSLHSYQSFEQYDQKYFVHFCYTILLLTFIFTARIKVFPPQSKEEKFNWLIEVFFSFYEIVFLQTWTSFDKKIIANIKKTLLKENDIFFMLQAIYEKVNGVFDVTINNEKDYYQRLFYDEAKDQWHGIAVQDFIKNCNYYNQQATFSLTEKKILPLVLPADILIRYLYTDADPYRLTPALIGSIFDKDTLKKYIQGFRKNTTNIEEFLSYITDFNTYKKWFFEGVKKYMSLQTNQEYNHEESEEIDEFMSSIGDLENIDMAKIPEKLKKESRFMEKILNFYISFVWWMRIARWDNFACKLYKREFMQKLTQGQKIMTDKKYSLQNYGALLYSYSKNSFYYKYAAENVRAGKEKFYVPFSNTLKKAQSNIYIIKLFHDNFIATVLQDINEKDIRLFVKNKQIVDTFKQTFGKKISEYINKESTLLQNVYQPLYTLTQIKWFETHMQEHLTQDDLYRIKDSLYTFDFRLWQHCIYKLGEKIHTRQDDYTSMNILWFAAQCRESILWLMLYLYYGEKNGIEHSDIVIELYITEILHMADHYIQPVSEIIKELYITYYDLIEQRTALDDNQKYMQLAVTNRNKFTKWLEKTQIKNNLIGEDIMRLRWFLKNISYYNKRFVIPQ